jgi:hypothetical protein
MEIENIISFSNLGTINKNSVTIGNLTLYFSYKTIVGFEDNDGLKVCENIWSKTTGKFLNELQNNKDLRLNRIEFLRELKKCLIKHKFIDINDEILKNLE